MVRSHLSEEISLVVVCPECCAYNSDSAVFCSNCGIQIVVGSPYPREIVQRYGVIEKTIGELSQENKALRERLSQQNESLEQRLNRIRGDVSVSTDKLKAEAQAHRFEAESRQSQQIQAVQDQLERSLVDVRASVEQLKAEDMSLRSNIQREFSDKIRSYEEQLAKALGQVQTLAAQIRADQQARRTETSRIDELVEANRKLVQQVRRLSVTRRYCDRCGRPLVATSDPNVLACPVCGVY